MAALIAVGSLAYMAHVLFRGSWITTLPLFNEAYRPVHWVLSLLPTAYAAYVLGYRFGLLATGAVVSIHTVYLAIFQNDPIALMAVMGILVIGLVISALAWFHELARHQQDLDHRQLELAHQALREHAAAVERQARHLAALGNLAVALNQTLDIATTTKRALDVALPALGAELGMVHLYHAGAGTLFLSGYRGWAHDQAQKVNFLSDTEEPLATVVARGEAVRVDNCSGDNSALGALIKTTSVSCFCATPVLEEDRVLGVLSVACVHHRVCHGEVPALLSAMGHQLGAAIARARQFEEVKRQQTQALALARVLQEDQGKLEQVQREGLENLRKALASVYPWTLEHSREVRRLALAAAQEMNLSERDKELLGFAAEYHDLGLLGLRLGVAEGEDFLLGKPRQAIAWHPELGVEFLEPLAPLREALPIIRCSHERWNGTGYPDSLMREAIPPLARLLAVADGYEWLLRGGPGRPPLALPEARARLQAGAGSFWEPRAVAALLRALDRLPDDDILSPR